MNESGGNFADEAAEMVSEGAVNPSTELRKRRSTRIVQAVPLMATGVDALGRPFVERTSSLIINCHGCRYQSKHYVLKNMWVTMEIPHPEAGQPPRTVRGKVAWIQRPRTVRQLFQVALELEIPGNVWGIAFPPEDWFVFSDVAQACTKTDPAQEAPPPVVPTSETEIVMPLEEPDTPPKTSADNVRVFPSPASTTDASLQLARQVARLVADAKQQIQTATREAASQAVSAERRLSFEQWEQKFAAGRAEIANEASRAIERLHEEADGQSRAAHAAAAEALRNELPRWLAPQLEQLTHELTSRLSQEGAAQRSEHAQQLEQMAETLRTLCHQGEETAAKLKTEAEQAQAQIAARAEQAARAIEEAARQREETAAMQRDALNSAAIEIQQRVDAATRSIGEAVSQQEQTATSQRDALSSAANEIRQNVESAIAATQSSWQGQLASEMEAAQVRWRAAIEGTLAEAQDRAAGGLNEHARGLIAQLQEEMAHHAAAVRESAMSATAETEQRMAALRDALQEQAQRLEAALQRARESSERIENHAEQLQDAKQKALAGFQAQLDDVLNLHGNELQRRSGSLIEEINERIRTTFEESTRQALATFDRQVEEMVQPHVSRTEEAIHRLAGGRSLLDAALALQQDRIRNSADEAFAESLGRFRENLGGVEQILQESSQTIVGRNLTELEGKVSDLKHRVVEELYKSAEWYEKKAQTQIQNQADRAIEQAANQLREKAGEVSSVFASELDHSSRSFVGHTQTQMEEVVRESFERARALFAEAADTTAAAFTDEVQRTGRQELDGFGKELRRAREEARSDMNAAREELAHRVTSEQQEFLRRFQASMGGALEAGVADARKKVEEGFEPLLASWKSMTDAHQKEMESAYGQIGHQAVEHYKSKLENVSNQWMLATVASLDHQSRDLISGIAATAEQRLREACAQVFAGVGESLRERLKEIASGFTLPEPPAQAKSANTGS
jgi:vacuolar-type H+-ATPase subunit E/Vma4